MESANKELTVIIPFLNEGNEVENTVNSLLGHTKEPIDIILINDNSDDGYNYKFLADKYKTRYIENSERKGVARSRDIGVELSETPYFLLLDAHMRFYDFNWYSILLFNLKSHHDTLFCCQSTVLSNFCGNVIERPSAFARGAVIDLDPTTENFLNARWNYDDKKSEQSKLVIACVLGAGYACSRRYWKRLHGLCGLESYGLDEQLISLKVWLSGGQCILLNDIALGHIYRTNAPYNIKNSTIVYNKMVICYLLLPVEFYNMYILFLEKEKTDIFNEVMKLWDVHKDNLERERRYFSEILTQSLDYFKSINKSIIKQERPPFHCDYYLAHVISDLPEDPYIFNGQAGFAFICLLMAKKENSALFENLAEIAFNKIWKRVNKLTSPYFSEGVSGIGWLVEYLCQNNFINGNPNIILTDIDEYVQYINWGKISDNSLDSGLCGIVSYVFSRVVGNNLRNESPPFQKEFLTLIDSKVYLSLAEMKVDNIEYKYLSSYIDYRNGEVQKGNLDKTDFELIYRMSKYKNHPICYCLTNLINSGI